jgi:hypothetical protein
MEQDNNQKKLAVLIDAENTQASIIEALLAEIAKYGVASVRRIYGDWTTTATRVEGCSVGTCHPADSTISLYRRKER